MMTRHNIVVARKLLAVVSSRATALLQVLLFRAWSNGRYPQLATSLAPLIDQMRAVRQQHNAPVEATRRGELARLVLRLHELDGNLDGLSNDLDVLRQCVALAAANERPKLSPKGRPTMAGKLAQRSILARRARTRAFSRCFVGKLIQRLMSFRRSLV